MHKGHYLANITKVYLFRRQGSGLISVPRIAAHIEFISMIYLRGFIDLELNTRDGVHSCLCHRQYIQSDNSFH